MGTFADHDGESLGAADLQRLMLRAETLPEFLTELAVRVARHTGQHCGITIRSETGAPCTVASSDPLSTELDELQYADGVGPCLEALNTGVPVQVLDMATETRWVPYPEHAVRVGALSSYSYPLAAGEQVLGALNLYAVQALPPELDLRAQAEEIAGLAVGALQLAIRFADQGELIGHLRTALISRSTIDQAIGIMMAQQRCDADAAFELLRQASQARNLKLRDIAAQIVASVERKAPGMPKGRY